MEKVNDINIYIVEKDFEKFKYLKPYFLDLEKVTLVNEDVKKFLKENKDIDCVVSPANSFGIMMVVLIWH